MKTGAASFGYIQFYYDSLRLVRYKALDLIQTEYLPHSSIVPAVFCRRDIPLVLKFHGDDARIFPFKNPLYRHIMRSTIRRAAYVITASEEMQKPLVTLGLDSECCFSVYTGVDTDFYSRSISGGTSDTLNINGKDVIPFCGEISSMERDQ